MLQARRLWVRLVAESLEFLIVIILLATLWPCDNTAYMYGVGGVFLLNMLPFAVLCILYLSGVSCPK